VRRCWESSWSCTRFGALWQTRAGTRRCGAALAAAKKVAQRLPWARWGIAGSTQLGTGTLDIGIVHTPSSALSASGCLIADHTASWVHLTPITGRQAVRSVSKVQCLGMRR